MPSSKSQSGSILFIIIIAVALFAAMSFAVTQSMRGNSSDVTEQKADLLAGQLFQWFSKAEFEFNRMNVISNVSPDGYNMVPPGHGWIHRCASPECSLFESDGGQVPEFYIADKEFWKNDSASACNGVPTNIQQEMAPRQVRIDGLGTDTGSEIVLQVICVSDEVCEAYNRKVGVSNSPVPVDPAEIIEYNLLGAPAGQTNEPATGVNTNIGDEAPSLVGRRTFCYRNGRFGGNETAIIYVLLDR